jgi:type II secretory pathway predicted ATPase ExeA
MTDTQQVSTTPPGRNAVVPGGIWPTRTARLVTQAIEACRLGRYLGLVTGPSGIGKTTAARAAVAAAGDEFSDEFVEAHYLRMTIAAEGLQPGLIRIGRAIGASAHPSMSASEVHDGIVYRMRQWPCGGLLVLDEAQFMADALIHAVRDIADELDGRGCMAGVVLMGDVTLAARINGKVGPRARQFEPLRGRLGAVVALDGLDAEDFSVISHSLGVMAPQAADLVARVGAGRGGLHNVARLANTARGIAGADNPITLGMLRTAAQVAGVGA